MPQNYLHIDVKVTFVYYFRGCNWKKKFSVLLFSRVSDTFNAFPELFFDHIYHFIQPIPSGMKERGFAEKDV